MKVRLFIFLIVAICSNYSFTQVIFAELQGNPDMITTGWNITGAAYTGDTGGDADNFNNELILTDAVNSTSGAIFYSEPIDLGTCNQWNVKFDFRMFEGSAADGIAFCFLDVPPTGFVSGGGVGIPSTANGIKVILDTYNNCGGPNPGIQIYSGPGYNECIPGITSLDNIGGTLSFLRSTDYSTAEISYNYGEITVTINGTLYLTANYTVNFAGYMGFTASTGGSTDVHSVRDVTIYAEIADADAGPDVSICSGETLQIGSPNNPEFLYSWNTAANLNDSTASDPSVTITNNTGAAIVQEYIVETILASNPNSCPVHDTVQVTVNPLQQTNLNEVICQGSSYTLGPNVYSLTGIYQEVFSDLNGCDSTVILDLLVNAELTAELNEIICQGASFDLGGTQYDQSGTYFYTTQNTEGCDSTITLNLSVLPELESTNNESICFGAVYDFGGVQYDQSGTYLYTTQNTQGCDSTITLNLTVLPELESTINQSICSGSVYDLGGIQYDESGTYLYTTQNAQGCDSTITLNLTVNPIEEYQFNVSICEGESYNYNGQVLNEAGSYDFLLQTEAGCDSLVALNLVVHPIFSTSEDLEICEGDELLYAGQSFTTTGAYNFGFQSQFGCDSFVVLNLIVNPTPEAPELSSNSPVNCFFDPLELTMEEVPGATTYYWYNEFGYNSNQSTHVINLEEMYFSNMYSESFYAFYILNTCYSDTSVIQVGVDYSFEDFDFPNVITANDDGINDELDIQSYIRPCQGFQFKLYNRWGNLVYSQSKEVMMYEAFPTVLSNSNFSGQTINNLILDDGIYFYTLDILRPSNTNSYIDLDFPDFNLFTPAYKSTNKTGYIHVVR